MSGPPTAWPRRSSQQEELTERFKSSNALLQNSLSYVGLLSTSPAFGAQDAQLAPATGALAAALLYLSARHITGRRQGAPGTDRPICGASAHYRAGRGSSAGAARAFPSTSRSPTCGRRDAEGPRRRAKQAASRRAPCTVLPPPVCRRSDGAALSAVALPGLATVAHHTRASRPAAAGARPCATTASSIRACHSREFDAPDQLPAGGNRRAAEASAGRTLPGDRRRNAPM